MRCPKCGTRGSTITQSVFERHGDRDGRAQYRCRSCGAELVAGGVVRRARLIPETLSAGHDLEPGSVPSLPDADPYPGATRALKWRDRVRNGERDAVALEIYGAALAEFQDGVSAEVDDGIAMATPFLTGEHHPEEVFDQYIRYLATIGARVRVLEEAVLSADSDGWIAPGLNHVARDLELDLTDPESFWAVVGAWAGLFARVGPEHRQMPEAGEFPVHEPPRV